MICRTTTALLAALLSTSALADAASLPGTLPDPWKRYLEPPKAYAGFSRSVRPTRTKDYPDFTVEWYR